MIDVKTLAEEIRYYTNGHWTPEGLSEYIGENFSADLTEEQRGKIAYALTKRLVIDMPTARSAVDEALSNAQEDSDPFYVASKRVEGSLDAKVREELNGKVQFLLDRLTEFEQELQDDEVARQYHGHVHPAVARLRLAFEQLSVTDESDLGEITHGTCSKCDELHGRIFEESEAAIFYKAAAVTNRQRAEIAEREVERLRGGIRTD